MGDGGLYSNDVLVDSFDGFDRLGREVRRRDENTAFGKPPGAQRSQFAPRD